MTVQLVVIVKDTAENRNVPVSGITLAFTLKDAGKKIDTPNQGSLSRAETEQETFMYWRHAQKTVAS